MTSEFDSAKRRQIVIDIQKIVMKEDVDVILGISEKQKKTNNNI